MILTLLYVNLFSPRPGDHRSPPDDIAAPQPLHQRVQREADVQRGDAAPLQEDLLQPGTAGHAQAAQEQVHAAGQSPAPRTDLPPDAQAGDRRRRRGRVLEESICEV